MKRFISLFLVLCLALTVFAGCTRDKDRAENNGIVTDNSSDRGDGDTTDERDRDTDKNSDRNDDDSSDDKGLIGDIGDGVSDVVEGATDAVDDILGGNDSSVESDRTN